MRSNSEITDETTVVGSIAPFPGVMGLTRKLWPGIHAGRLVKVIRRKKKKKKKKRKGRHSEAVFDAVRRAVDAKVFGEGGDR